MAAMFDHDMLTGLVTRFSDASYVRDGDQECDVGGENVEDEDEEEDERARLKTMTGKKSTISYQR